MRRDRVGGMFNECDRAVTRLSRGESGEGREDPLCAFLPRSPGLVSFFSLSKKARHVKGKKRSDVISVTFVTGVTKGEGARVPRD